MIRRLKLFAFFFVLAYISVTFVARAATDPTGTNSDPFGCDTPPATGATGIPNSTGGISQTVQPYQQSVCQYKGALEGNDVNLQKFNLGILDNTMMGVTRQITGQPQTKDEIASGQQAGVVPLLMEGIKLTYTQRPASGIEYIAQLKDKITGNTYAASVSGYNSLSSVQNAWTGFRNIALLFYVLIFILYGFMIIFRRNINANTVASIQNALPKIVVSLILVTFSYAIVGAALDLLNFVIALIIYLFAQNHIIKDAPTALSGIYQKNVFSFVYQDILQNGGFNSAVNTGNNLAGAFIDNLNVADILKELFKGVAGALAGVIVAIAIFFAVIRLFFSLLKAYVIIIFLTIFGPIMIAAGTIPGVPGFGAWMKNITAQLSIFVVAIIMLILAGYFAGTGYSEGLAGKITYSNGWTAPLIGGFDAQDGLSGLIAIAIILGIPSAAKLTQDAFKIKSNPAINNFRGTALGGLAMGAAVARYPAQPTLTAAGQGIRNAGQRVGQAPANVGRGIGTGIAAQGRRIPRVGRIFGQNPANANQNVPNPNP